MFSSLRFILTLLGGVLIGLGSAWWAIGHLRFEASESIGPWAVVESSTSGNPYERARLARRGSGGLGPSEGLELVSEMDSRGLPLDAACTYLVTGPVPQGLLWTLAVSDRDGKLPQNAADRVGFTALDALAYTASRQVRIGFGPDVRPGDFVATTGLNSLRFTLRLYSSVIATRRPTSEQLPTITPVDCQNGAAP